MTEIIIDGIKTQVENGVPLIQTLLDLGHHVPHMCFYEGLNQHTSCMICVVKDVKTGSLFPSCSVKAREGMEIITGDEEISEARKTALELLLSDHVGDCEAPCIRACPAHMDIPKMIRHLQEDNIEEALEIVKKDIALPGVLGRICPAPCEKACRRKDVDEPVSICLLKRYSGDEGKSYEKDWSIIDKNLTGKKVAIIGGGPGGLAAAYHLQLKGVKCKIIEKSNKAGGLLRSVIDDAILPQKVLDEEIDIIAQTGVEFQFGVSVDKTIFESLKKDFDAVIIATGDMSEEMLNWGMKVAKQGINVNRNTYETNIPGVFAIGGALRHIEMAIKSIGHGKEASFSVIQYLKGEKIIGEPGLFDSRFGTLSQDEIAEYLKESVENHRTEPEHVKIEGFTKEEMIEEAARCLHCDCRKVESCKLRMYAGDYQVDQKRFYPEERKHVRKILRQSVAMFEPAKCIKCGICVRLTTKQEEEYGLTFVGRGFDIEIGIPFNEELEQGITMTAEELIKACPTGALSKNDIRTNEEFDNNCSFSE